MPSNKNISIIKADGTRAKYDPEKLIKALLNSGANRNQSQEIARKVEQKLYDGIPSRKIYQLAYSLLRQKKAHRVAGRYRLKKAIFELGPSGYPFEHFVGKLFESFGYQVETGQHIRGKCVEHEVDVVAIKPGEQVIVECKFRSDYRARTNVQVPLYIDSRFKDIKEKWAEENRAKVGKDCRLFLQPEWSRREDAVKIIVDYVLKNPQWKVSSQIHKYMHIP